jgi:hypothetical protein
MPKKINADAKDLTGRSTLRSAHSEGRAAERGREARSYRKRAVGRKTN